ncbi:MAG: hypothetical protein M0R70_12800 [Nitrospirae bacterium]|nr:hypothetical protein [Nitrospirota bacterium]
MGCEYRINGRGTRSFCYGQRCGFLRSLTCTERIKFEKSIEKKKKKVRTEIAEMDRSMQAMSREIGI